MYACNHETHVDLVGHQVRYVCGKCGLVVWTHPAKYRTSWPWVVLLACLVLIWSGLAAWMFWVWFGGAS